jgi:anti-sigma factor RsiW
MSDHMTEWLNAYMDGELKGNQLHQVEQHLFECEKCRAGLQSLKNLSTVLHSVPAPQFTPSERFAAQVGLQLTREPIGASKRKVLEIGWWMIPVGLLLIWVLIGTASWVANMLVAANSLGLLSGVPAWLVQGSTSGGASWANTLAEYGFLSGTSLKWSEVTETFAKQFALHVSIAVVYLGWMAIWWAGREERRQLLGG